MKKQELKIPELISLTEHCQGIRIAFDEHATTVNGHVLYYPVIIGYIPCAECIADENWCGSHPLIQVKIEASRKKIIQTFRETYDRARAGGLIPMPTEQPKPIHFANVIPFRRKELVDKAGMKCGFCSDVATDVCAVSQTDPRIRMPEELQPGDSVPVCDVHGVDRGAGPVCSRHWEVKPVESDPIPEVIRKRLVTPAFLPVRAVEPKRGLAKRPRAQ